MKGSPELLEKLNNLFIEITREKISPEKTDQNFEDHVKKSLRLNTKEDFNFIITAEDILEDSNLAIQNFLQFGFLGPTKINNEGEAYLRLYGLLNATYLQQQSISMIYKLMQCKGVKCLKKHIEGLEITKLRHKIGAHSAGYKCPVTKAIKGYVPVRYMRDDFSWDTFEHTTNTYDKVEFKEMLEKHFILLCATYYLIIKKLIKTVYKPNPDKKALLLERLKLLRKEIDGDIITELPDGSLVVKRYIRSIREV